ncbi:hypothetical protein ACN6KF_005686 [Labrys sp. La1]|uniref:hypothetical protein n=1 Tax=Labrys sp. La1 TaxID=3404917 RepID=UPI003EC10A35
MEDEQRADPNKNLESMKVPPLQIRPTTLLTLAMAASLALPAMAQQQPAQAPASAVPAPANAASVGPQTANLEPKTVLVLVRSTLIALDQANKTGNYSVLRDLGAPDFQRENSNAKLAEIFAAQRKGRLDLAAALVLEPAITLVPQVEKNGLLHLAGFFPVDAETKLTFELFFQGVDGRLLLYGLTVNIAQVGATPNDGSHAAPIPAPTASAPPAAPVAAPIQAAASSTKPKPKPRSTAKPKIEPAPAPIQRNP